MLRLCATQSGPPSSAEPAREQGTSACVVRRKNASELWCARGHKVLVRISFGLEVGFSGFVAWIPGQPGVDFGVVFGGEHRSGGGNPRPLENCSQNQIRSETRCCFFLALSAVSDLQGCCLAEVLQPPHHHHHRRHRPSVVASAGNDGTVLISADGKRSLLPSFGKFAGYFYPCVRRVLLVRSP